MSAPPIQRMLADFSEHGVARTESARQALATVLALGLPTARDENWKYASLRQLERVHFGASPRSAADTLQRVAELLPPLLDDYARLLFVDGRLVSPPLLDMMPAGLLQGPPGASAPLLPETLDRDADQRFAAINRAFAPDPQRLTVESGARVRLEIICVATLPAETATAHPSIEIEVRPGGGLSLVERHLSTADIATFTNSWMRIKLGPSATCRHYRSQLQSARSHFLQTLAITQEADSDYWICSVEAGAATSRLTANAQLAGRDARLAWQSVAVGETTQVNDTAVRIEHTAAGTRTQQMFRGISNDRSRLAFNGHMIVRAEAPGAIVEQSLRSLLAGPESEADLRPQLEIYTDQVKASHGATAGKLDEQMAFYLASRGLDPATAQALLKWAFVGDVLSHIDLLPIRVEAERAVAGRLRGLDVPGETR